MPAVASLFNDYQIKEISSFWIYSVFSVCFRSFTVYSMYIKKKCVDDERNLGSCVFSCVFAVCVGMKRCRESAFLIYSFQWPKIERLSKNSSGNFTWAVWWTSAWFLVQNIKLMLNLSSQQNTVFGFLFSWVLNNCGVISTLFTILL